MRTGTPTGPNRTACPERPLLTTIESRAADWVCRGPGPFSRIWPP